ncbi:MAG: type II toxin-antitoxin system HicB family antitoxin [Planctomycetota bacterium]
MQLANTSQQLLPRWVKSFRPTEGLYVFEAILQEEESGYSVFAPHYPGVISQGDTVKESVDNISEAFALMIECSREDGIPLRYIPIPEIESRESDIRIRVEVNA